MLKITSIIATKGEAWEREHICNIVYVQTNNDESDVLSVLHAESFADGARFTDGARLESLAKGLKMDATDKDGNHVKVSCFVQNDWLKTLENVNAVLVGVTDPTAYAFHISAAEIMRDESVVALSIINRPEMLISNVPCIGHGKTEEEAKAKAVAKQSARWKLRVEKNRAIVTRATTATTAE